MHLSGLLQITATTILSCLCLLSRDQLAAGLRDVHVKVPHAVRRGEKAVLKCFYDLEGDSLYSVKWYKGRREFYSYTPKETPAMKVFQFAGVKVERSSSNESQLVLESVNLATTGKYSCEVSADAPSFHTLISAGELEVVEAPGKDPIITGIRPRYRVGDIVRGNCTSRHSKPAANLTWTINGYETNPSHIRHHKPLKDAREMETSISGIHFVITPQHFIYGKLKIRCTAFIHDVYWKSTEKSIEEDRHKHSAGWGSINLVNTFSEDYFDPEDENLVDRSDTYLTNINGGASSLNSAAKSTLIAFAPRAITMAMLLLHSLQLLLQLFMRQSLLLWRGPTMQDYNDRAKNNTNNNSGNNNNKKKKNHNNNNSEKQLPHADNSNNHKDRNNNDNNGNNNVNNSSQSSSHCNNNNNSSTNNTNNSNSSNNGVARGQHLSVANVLRSEPNVKGENEIEISERQEKETQHVKEEEGEQQDRGQQQGDELRQQQQKREQHKEHQQQQQQQQLFTIIKKTSCTYNDNNKRNNLPTIHSNNNSNNSNNIPNSMMNNSNLYREQQQQQQQKLQTQHPPSWPDKFAMRTTLATTTMTTPTPKLFRTAATGELSRTTTAATATCTTFHMPTTRS